MSKQAVAIIFAGFLTVSIAYSIRYGFGMLLPEMLPALDMSKTEAGAIVAVYFIIYTAFTPVLGFLSDHLSYRIILTAFAAILGLGALLMASAQNSVQGSIYFSVAAIGHAACWAPVVSLVQKWVPDNRRGTALSFVSTGVGTGIFIWGILLPLFVNQSGWRSGWWALGVTGLVIALINLILIRNPENKNNNSKNQNSVSQSLKADYQDIFKQTSFWIIGIAYLMVGFNVILMFSFLPVYARESLNLEYAISTRFISVIAFFGIIGQLFLGTLSDRIGRIRIMIFCGLIIGIGCLGLVFTREVVFLYLITAFYGLGYGAIWPVYAAAASDLYSKTHTGGVIGLWTLFLGIGSIIAPVVCGWILDRFAQYTWVFLLGFIVGTLSAVLLLFVPKKQGQ